VTLDGLARLIAAGQDVSVREQKSGADITNTVLAQVILEALKERTARIPRPVLLRLIRLGMRPAPARRGGARPAPPDAASRAREEAEKIVTGLLKRGRLPLEEALALRQEIAATLHKAVGEAQRGVERRFHSLMEWTERESGISPALQTLKERLLTFETPAARRPARRKARRPGTTPHRNREWKEP
jgi:polyhydroxyalkanoate synthesis regulator phasin